MLVLNNARGLALAMWKILWYEARSAAAQDDLECAAELFTRSLFEAQRSLHSSEPEFDSFLKERNEFYRIYSKKNRSPIETFQNLEALPHHKKVNQPGSDDFTIWKLCSQCGKSLKFCGCRSLIKYETKKPAPIEPGDMIAKKYQIVRNLGSGGMAVIYLVRDPADKLFAMKILNSTFVEESEASERFEREARVIRKMRHPRIISVFDFGRTSDGRPFYVMEFVEGECLLSLLEREVRLNAADTCTVGLQICDAMAHAHNLGIIHRDLKPSNIILLSGSKEYPEVKIVDFGIAKLNQSWDQMESRLTQEGQILGSPAYMSPEQCLGNEIDHRSDIYSIGCVLYQLLCGAPPFWAEHSLALLYKQVNEEPPSAIPSPVETISAKLEKIILKTLQKDPNARYQSMLAMESDLLDCVT
jgi:tRNA A-37 threonylcarbamoyl transferase component Bud32